MKKKTLKSEADKERDVQKREAPPWEKLDKVELSALEVFTSLGYDAASVSIISKKAGISKSSVYAHCESKEDLFRNVLEPVMERELYLFQKQFLGKDTVESLGAYFHSFLDRAEESPPFLRFFLRAVYTPPAALQGWVKSLSEYFFEKIMDMVSTALKQQGLEEERLPELSRVYVALLDSVQVSALYCPQVLSDRSMDMSKLFSFLCAQRGQ